MAPLTFAVVCEARADQRTACALADRVICDANPLWIEPATINHYRQWRGVTLEETHILWTDVPRLAAGLGRRTHGHFGGAPGALDAQATRRVLLLLKDLGKPLDGVFLLRDDDRQTERRLGIEQAIGVVDLGVPIVVGLAHVKRECWVLAGYDPVDDRERDCLEELRQELGFNPNERPEQLHATEEQAKRSAKRVLGLLTAGDAEREARCWAETSLTILRTRGTNAGLADFLDQIREKIVPLFR